MQSVQIVEVEHELNWDGAVAGEFTHGHRFPLLPVSLNWHIGRVKPANSIQSAVLSLNFLRLKEHFDHLPHFLLLLCHSFDEEANFGLTALRCLST